MLSKKNHKFLIIKVLLILLTLNCYAQLPFFKKDTTVKVLYQKSYVDTLNQHAFNLRNSNISQAKIYVTQSIAVAESINYQKGLARALGLMGLLDLRLGEYEASIKHHFKSLVIAENILDSQQIAFRYNDIANVYQAEGDNEQALVYYTKSLKVKELIKDTEGIATTYNNIAGIYIQIKQYSEALIFIKKAQHILKKHNFPRILAINYGYYAEIFTENEKYDSALYYHKQAMIIQEKLGDKYTHILNVTDIGYIYARQKKYSIAIQYYLEALDKSNKYQSKQLTNKIYQKLAEAYAATNNFKEAYKYQIYVTLINDSLFHQRHDEKLILLETKKKFKENEAKFLILKQQSQLQIEKQTQQEIWLLLAVVIILFLILIGFLAVRNLRQKTKNLALLSAQKQEIEEQNEKLYDLNIEKDGLIHVVAHDLRSPLNRVKGFMTLLQMEGILLESQKEYIKMVEKSCESGITLIKDLLLINDAENDKAVFATTKIELNKFIEDIVWGFQLNAQKKQIILIFTKHHEKVEFETEINFLERILDNLLSNAIKFSFPNSTITLSLIEENHQVSISIKDEGQGMSEIDKTKVFKKFQKLSAQPTAGEDSTGLGLSIVKALVEQLKGTIEVQSEFGKGTEFIIKF